MTGSELYARLKGELFCRMEKHGLFGQELRLNARGLTPEEAIGTPERRDYPILAGKEVMLQAHLGPSCGNACGQAFTSAPADFDGPLERLLEAAPGNDAQSLGLLVAALNAVLRYTGEADHTVHCRNDEMEQCAERYAAHISERFGAPRIALVGYQPALTARLPRDFAVRVLDLNEQVVGTRRSGIYVEDGEKAYEDAVLDWAELVLVTGSTLCNGSFVKFTDIGKPVLFYGTSGAAAAAIFGLERFCPMSK